ncbi:hypothetical protein ACFZBU_35530 [Embleya sp. NPDC008237]|uniref:hypothetical protein n=1 Tax=unclassified Embleya TaxID=2699296 RepID=UPI0036E5AE58
MVQQCFTPSQAGVHIRLTQVFGRIAEWFIRQEYCLAKGGCSEFLTLPGGPQTDFFDENAGTTRCRYLAAFLKFHHPALDEIFVAQTCEIRKRDDDDEGEKFPVPDIITHDPAAGRREFYEVKPNSQSSKSKGRVKLNAFQAMVDFLRTTSVPTMKYDRGTLFDPDRSILLWDGTWFGSPVQVFFHFFREEEGLLVYEVCVKVTGQLLAEVFVKALIKLAVLAVLSLFVPVAGGVVVLAENSPLEDSVGNGGGNGTQDTRYVQALLNDWRGNNGRGLIGLDGLVGNETIGAITDFQTTVTHIVDGRVDVGGAAMTALEQAHVDHALVGAVRTEMDQVGTDGLTAYILKPDPDGLAEGQVETDLVTAAGQAVAQYFTELHAEA